MRWERLLADVAAVEEARQRAELLADAAERSRAEVGQVSLLSRLRAAEGQAIACELDGGVRCGGTIEGVGLGWVALQDGAEQWLIATRHLGWVDHLPRLAAPEPTGAAKRVFDALGMRHVLRGIAADRAGVRIGLGGPEPVSGTIDRVGADFIDLALHPDGEPRRRRVVSAHRAVAIDAIRYVHRLVG